MENVSASSSEAAERCCDTVTDSAQHSDVISGDLAVIWVVYVSPMVSIGRCPLAAKLANAATSEQRLGASQNETRAVC